MCVRERERQGVLLHYTITHNPDSSSTMYVHMLENGIINK